MVAEAGWIPVKPDVFDHPPGDWFRFLDKFLIVDVKDREAVQVFPVLHQLHVIPVGPPKGLEVRRERHPGGEGVAPAGEACVEGIAPAVDDAGFGKEQRNEADVQVVQWQLVCDALNIARISFQNTQVSCCHVVKEFGRGLLDALRKCFLAFKFPWQLPGEFEDGGKFPGAMDLGMACKDLFRQ